MPKRPLTVKRALYQPPPSDTPKIALVGRPNVGKSTLFNRLIRSKRAITHDMPGITRDRMEGTVRGKGKCFILIDTGGVTLDAHSAPTEGPAALKGFEEEILRQTQIAISEAAFLVLVVDARDGLSPFDEHLGAAVRRSGKPAMVAVNKVDGPENADAALTEFYSLGLPLLPVSAEHGFNVRALEEEMRDFLFRNEDDPLRDDEENLPLTEENTPDEDGANGPLRLAFIGRPNAGKSSLVNKLAGSARMIVSDLAGTTRDSVDVCVEIDGVPITFVDTAGIRRPARVVETVERYSANSSIKSTTKAHVTFLVVDGPDGLTQQDKRLIELCRNRMIPFAILINKSDLMNAGEQKTAARDYQEALVFCSHVPLLFISAAKGTNLQKIIPLARRIRRECAARVSTGELNRAFEAILATHQPPMLKGARAKFYYMTQAETRPPTFVFFVNNEERISPSYARYVERSLRKTFGITHAPLRVHFRSTHSRKNK
ncbi:GTPase Der [Deltaproteobacteria bacterium]|nr:GTPase Der [Deltaproteobacteria bacterium]